MNTRYILTLLLLSGILWAGCKKASRQDPPKIVSYKIELITGSNTHLRYTYNAEGLLARVDGKDRDKSLTCDITYDLDRVYLDYNNRTANEHWLATLEVDPATGYITRFDDGMYVATFSYDSVRFQDGVSRLVASYYSGGKYEGDSLCYRMIYNPDGTLRSCWFRGESRSYEYYTDDMYESNISTVFTEAVLGRFERIVAYLPYTFGPPQQYLPKTVVSSGAFYTNYTYNKDEYGRVRQVVVNGAATDYKYMDE